MGSKSFSLDVTDLTSVLKNAVLVAIAAFLTAMMNNLHLIDLGQYTALVIPVVTLILDSAVKWVKNNVQEDQVVEKKGK